MEILPVELFGMLLEHISSLNDLGALWLVNRQTARLCAIIPAKTVWRITYRTLDRDCEHHMADEEAPDEFPCNCSVVKPALEDPRSVPFKVRAWLYRCASVRSFGRSNESLSGCIVSIEDDVENPFDPERGRRKLGIPWHEVCEEDSDIETGEWAKVWLILKRHLVMQRVQRVNSGDETVKPW